MSLPQLVHHFQSSIDSWPQADILRKCLSQIAGFSLDNEALIRLALISPMISMAYADGQVSFLEKCLLKKRLAQDGCPDVDALGKVVAAVIAHYDQLEAPLLELCRLIVADPEVRETMSRDIIHMASVDGGFATLGNYSLLLLAGLAGSGLGSRMVFNDEIVPRFASCISSREADVINKICRLLELDEITVAPYLQEEIGDEQTVIRQFIQLSESYEY